MPPRGLKRSITFLGAVAVIAMFSLGYIHVNMRFTSSINANDGVRRDDHREHKDIQVLRAVGATVL
jgi:hypothetical protein